IIIIKFSISEKTFKNIIKNLLPYSKCSEKTRLFLMEIFEILMKHISKTFDRKCKILDFHHPHQLLDGIEGFSLEITGEAESLEQILVDCRDTLKYGVKTGHPRFFNQLSSGLDIISLAADWLTSTANTNMFTYEIAPVFTLMEDVVIRRMCSIIGWEDGEGIFSPGGSINNLYAVIMARHYVMPEVKYDGMRGFPELVMFQSKHAHYSNKRPGAVLGIGLKNCIDIEVDDKGRMIASDLELKILQSKLAGKVPFYVTATAGTTVIGAFDKIPEISGICKKYGVWLHVDAAWGGAVMMSQKHRHLVTGIELADSVTWNPHKMMGVVLQCSALLTRHKGILESCNEMNADYLFQQDKHYDVTYDTGDKTIQCGRHVDVFKLWLAWRAKGDAGFEKHVDRCIELSRYLVRKIRKTRGFELVNPEPEYANVCFWYFPPCIRNLSDETIKHEKLNKVAPLIKSRMMENGTIMIGYQPLGSKVNFFRNIVSNPAVDYDDIDFIITEIERLGRDI
uniref:Glutamate decarboxylase n=1 Tax=Ciona savignyi TaxID=51511 RepID=H2ZAN0_CIOSA